MIFEVQKGTVLTERSVFGFEIGGGLEAERGGIGAPAQRICGKPLALRRRPAAVGGRRLENSVQLATWLLDEHGLVVVPGAGFGREGYLRLSFAASPAVLDEAFDRLERGLRTLAGA